MSTSSTSAKFYHCTESDKDLLSKIREDKAGRPSIVLTRKAVVDETHISKSKKVCKSNVGIVELYLYSMCQPMAAGLYIRYEFDADLQMFQPRQNKSRSFENMVMSYSQRMRLDCWGENFYTTGTQKKIVCFNANGVCAQCLKQWVVFGITVLVKRHDLLYLKRTFDVEQKEGTGWNAETVYQGDSWHYCRIVGMWMVKIL